MTQQVSLAGTYQKIQSTLPKSPITFISDATLAKHFDYVDGVIQQTKPNFRLIYQATVIEITIIDLFNGLTSNDNITLICGYPQYNDVPFIGNVTFYAKDEFPKYYPGIDPYIILVTNADGTVSLHTTRTLKTLYQSVFLIIDIDVSDNAPAFMQHKTAEEVLALLESVAPGCFADTLVVDVPSSSNGITAPNSTNPTGNYKRHLYFQVIDASDIPRFLDALIIKTVIAGQYYTDKNGKVQILIDRKAVSRERFCYEVFPIMNGSVTKQTSPIRLLGTKLLDTKLLANPTADEVSQYESIMGEKNKVTTTKNGAVTFGTPNRISDLTWDMPVILSNRRVITPQQFKDEGLSDEPCYSPFRTDNNPSAKMGLDSKGNPFIYDAGTGESHFLALETQPSAIEGELVDTDIAVNVDDMFDIYTTAEAIAEMNTNYAIVMMGGKCLVMEKNSYNPALKCNCIEFHPTSTFAAFNAYKRVKTDDEYQPIVKYWLSHRLATRYNKMVFNPTNEPQAEGVFNLFNGLTRKPKKGSWRKFLRHIRHIICGGDKTLTRYVIAWLANMVQGRPKPGVALVLIGGKGTGKGAFANTIGQLFGRHFLQIVQRNQLTGNFNAHLREAFLVFADEAFWAGDKQAESALKALITEPLLMIEQKGLDAFQIANYTNFIFATNNEWSVPAGQGERRFCVFNVSNAKQQNHQYFNNLQDSMIKHGGLEAMLHDLLAFDLSDFNLRNVPSTPALSGQKYQSDIVLQFLIDRIDNESLYDQWDNTVHKMVPAPWGQSKVTKADFYEAFTRFVKQTGQRVFLPKETFGKQIKKWIGNIRESKWHGSPCHIFPSVQDCKDDIDKNLGSPFEWTPNEAPPTGSGFTSFI